MQVNYNYNWQECIGGPTSGFVKRNLWSWLESVQLRPDTKTYDQFSGIWYDNWIFGNNAIVTGSLNPNLLVTPNTGSFGGYNINWSNPDQYMYWPNKYSQGQPNEFGNNGASIFIQWQPSTTFTGSVSLFNTTKAIGATGVDVAWWGGNSADGNTRLYLGWPNANNYTPDQTLQTGSANAPYLGNITTPVYGTAITAWNSGVGYGVSGSQVAVLQDNAAYFVKNNATSSAGFNWEAYKLQFGRTDLAQYPWQPPNTIGQATQPFRGTVKRILIYNSVLSTAEVIRNFNYLQTLP